MQPDESGAPTLENQKKDDQNLWSACESLLEKLAPIVGRPPKQLIAHLDAAVVKQNAYAARQLNQPLLPRPRRYLDFGYEALLRDLLGSHYPAYVEAMKSEGSTQSVLNNAEVEGKLPSGLSKWLMESLDGQNDESTRNAIPNCSMGENLRLESRFQHRDGVVLDVAPELHALLAKTDIGQDLPWSQLKLPYPACYIHVPPDHPGITTLPEHKDARIDGIYVFEHVSPETGKRSITSALVQNEGGISGLVMTDLVIEISEEDQIISETVTAHIRSNWDESPNIDSMIASAHSTFDYVAKVMLYLSLPDRHILLQNERTEANKRARAAPAGLMRKKREANAERTYDRIIVGQGIESDTKPVSGAGGGHRAAHWRRGHFRGQRFGPGRSGIKTIWIRPLLIGLKHGDEEPQRKRYDIKL